MQERKHTGVIMVLPATTHLLVGSFWKAQPSSVSALVWLLTSAHASAGPLRSAGAMIAYSSSAVSGSANSALTAFSYAAAEACMAAAAAGAQGGVRWREQQWQLS